MQAIAPSNRWQIVPFWLAVFGRSAGANSIRVFALLTLRDTIYQESAITLLFAWLILSAVPAVLLTPLIGAIAGSSFRRVEMILGGLMAIGAALACIFQKGPWLGAIGILAIEGAFFAASRQVMVVSLSRRAWFSFPQLQALIGVGVLGGAVTGILFGFEFDPKLKLPENTLPLPIQVGLIGYAVMILGLLFSTFPVETEWTPRAGIVQPFLRAVGAVIRGRYTRISLILLLIWMALFLLLLGRNYWMLSSVPGFNTAETFGLALVIGVVIGGLLHFHPFRAVSIVPPAMSLLAVFLCYSVMSDNWTGPVWIQGILLGSMVMPLMTLFQSQLPRGTQGNGMAYLFMGCGIVTCGIAMILLQNRFDSARLNSLFDTLLVLLSLAAAIYSWIVLFLPFVETLGEYALMPMHRVSHVGPGVWTMPWNEPVLIIANHAAMLDPLWLSIVVPQTTRPMMISNFYDLPVISWLMRKVIGAIRVQDSLFRREAPEIKEAIAALKAGDSVMIFPEGWLRRNEEIQMRRFSRGVWQILKACPDIPVYAFWIEGGWGSFFSFKDGALMKNKPIDKLRRIRIAGIEGRKVDPKILEKHLQTRALLMEWVLEARALLGLPPIDVTQSPQGDDQSKKEGEA